MMNFGQIFHQIIITNSFLLFIFFLAHQTRISRTEEQANDATVDKLNVPVAFPIYRPPLETVQRQKTSVENVQRQPLRFHSLPQQHPVPAMAPASPPFSPSNLTAGHVEEISGQGSESSIASPEEATEEEESENQNHRDTDGDEQPFLTQKSTSTVPTVTIQLGKENADSSSADDSAIGTRNNGNTGKGGKTKGPMKMKMSKSAGGGGIESILTTTAAATENSQSLLTADRRLHPQQQQSASSARPVSVINTPQFQLFTGMGMEIIDSHEGSNEQAAGIGTTISASSLGQNNAASTKEEAKAEEENNDGHHHHKMLHYNRAESNASSIPGSPIQMVHLSTLGAESGISTTTKSPPSISTLIKTTTSMDSLANEKVSTLVPNASSSTLRTLTSSTVRGDATKLKTSSINPAEGEEKADEAFKTEATAKLPTILSTTGVPTSADEVTEDLLAMLNHSPPSPPPFVSAKNQSSNLNNKKANNNSSHFMPTPPNKPPTQFPVSAESNDQLSRQIGLSGGHDELDAGFERQTQQIPPGAEIEGVNGSGQGELAQTTPSSPINEQTDIVLTRPTKPPPQNSLFWSTTAEPPSNENIASNISSRIFTRFPLLWTSTIAQENPTKFTRMPATKFETTSNGFGQHWQPIGAKTTTTEKEETPQPPTFNWGGRISPSIKATTTEWPMGNHLGETEEEEHEPTEGENELHGHQPTMSSSTQKSTVENGNIGSNGDSRIGAENVHNSEENVQASEASSKFSSSTIHHQPTSNLRVFIIGGIILAVLITVIAGSVCTAKYVKKSRQLHGKYRPAAYEMQTQHQHRFQQPDYVQHIIPSSNSISQPPNQQQTAIFNGKEERLI